MIIMVTQWYPTNKAKKIMELFLKASKGPLPSFIKKWQIFTCPDSERGFKGYNLIMTEKDKGDETLMHITKTFQPFWDIEGFSMRIETLLGIKDVVKVMGRT